MMSKKKCGIIVLLVAAILSALCMSACSKRGSGNDDDGALGSVPQESIVFTVDGDTAILSWQAVTGATSYEVKIGDFSFITSETSVNLREILGLTLPDGDFDIIITAMDGSASSESTTFKANVAEAEELQDTFILEPITTTVLKWKPMKDIKSFRVVDIDYNVTTVTGTSYDMFDKKIVLGVYPVESSDKFDVTKVKPLDIKYLEGNGTQDSPYLIKKPFDIRAIEYYESRYYNEKQQNKNYYKIANDMDYRQVNVLDSVSNMFTLHKPFFGTLDGDGKKLSNVSVHYDGGYWALFDFLAQGSTVKNIVFDSPEIENKLQVKDRPINATISTIDNWNYCTVSGITLTNAKYTATGGEVCGIVCHN
ncbi:MAG: hypothetical protein K2N18_05695, partial [Clostridia bacterium]|nr:hypothetical protein [Clostridia bacterium]